MDVVEQDVAAGQRAARFRIRSHLPRGVDQRNRIPRILGDTPDDLVHAPVRPKSKRIPMQGVQKLPSGGSSVAQGHGDPAQPETSLGKLGVDPERLAKFGLCAFRVAQVPCDLPGIEGGLPGFLLGR
jgi:hypothetical protein